jgi:hypothetical protein
MDTPVGTIYRAISDSKRPGQLLCGGCGNFVPVTLIQCEQKLHPYFPPAPLVFESMEVVPD